MKLKKLGNSTYVLLDLTNIGLYLYDKNNVAIIDTGLSKENGKEIVEICKNNNWNIKMIINTHSHADHVGGNNYIQSLLNVPIYANKMERILIENPILLSTIAYGGYPFKTIQSSVLTASSSKTKQISNKLLPEGLTYFNLPGHCQDMIGIKTNDNVYFMADALVGEKILDKLKVQFMFNVEKSIETLNHLKNLKGEYFVPSHGEVYSNIEDLAVKNIENINDMIELIKDICKQGQIFDNLMKNIFEMYHMKMNETQYNIVSATIKCYLSYMLENKLIKNEIRDNNLLWVSI